MPSRLARDRLDDGQYVVLGDGSFAHWGGAAWTSGGLTHG
jgi:hypothetical protein